MKYDWTMSDEKIKMLKGIEKDIIEVKKEIATAKGLITRAENNNTSNRRANADLAKWRLEIATRKLNDLETLLPLAKTYLR